MIGWQPSCLQSSSLSGLRSSRRRQSSHSLCAWGRVVLAQPSHVLGAALGVADGVHAQGEVAKSQGLQESPAQLYYLGVDGSVGVTVGFDAELVVLAIPARLGPLVPEHGAQVEQAHGLG